MAAQSWCSGDAGWLCMSPVCRLCCVGCSPDSAWQAGSVTDHQLQYACSDQPTKQVTCCIRAVSIAGQANRHIQL